MVHKLKENCSQEEGGEATERRACYEDVGRLDQIEAFIREGGPG